MLIHATYNFSSILCIIQGAVKKKIALFGGMFDPPHWGHCLVAEQVLEKRPDIDEVWLIPDNTHPFSKKRAQTVASADDRLAMVSLCSRHNIKASRVAMDLGGVSYSIKTVAHLQHVMPHRFEFIIGSDGLLEFHKWKDAKKLSHLIRFIVFPRAGFPVQRVPGQFTVIDEKDAIVSSVSSTVIRKRVSEGKSIAGLVPSAVNKYIQQHQLYRTK